MSILTTHKGNKARVAPDLSTRLGAALRKPKRGWVQPAHLKSKPDGHRALGLIAVLILVAILVLPLIPTGTVLADVTEVRVAASSDDATNSQGGTGAGYWALAGTFLMAGYISASDGWAGAGMRFLNIDIPQGAVIESAYLTFVCKFANSNTVVNTRISAEDVDNPATFANDRDAFMTRHGNRTTARVNWDAIPAWTAGTTYTSPDIKTVIQEIVDRAGWADGNAIVIFWDDYDQRSTTTADRRRHGKTYDDSAADAPKLTITWSAVEAPTVVTNDATDVSYTTATVAGNITATGGADVTTRGFEWGTAEGGPYPNDWHEDGTYGTGTFSRGLTGLSHNTTYYFRAYAENSEGTSYGSALNFTTLLCTAPTVVTDSAIDVSYTIATMRGIIMDVGSVNATMRGFQWGTSTGVYTWSWNQTGDYEAEGFEHDLTGLDDDTTYYYRAFAVNPGGTSYGLEDDFTTTAYTAPTVVTHNATDISYTYGNLGGNITDVDGINATIRGFEWGYASGAPYAYNWTENGNYGTGTFSYNLTGLADDTTVYFRAMATNEGGTGYGAELSFTTLAYVLPTVVTLNATAIDETLATISGNITSIGSHNVTARGFDWGYSTGNYTGNWTEAGDFTGDFSYNLTALPYNTTIYYRAKAENVGGWSYGAELTFTTLLPYPGAPTNFTITKLGYSTFELAWDMGTLAATTMIRVSETAYPTSVTDGILVYSGNGGSVILDSLNPDMTSYYYTAWSENDRGYSDDAAQAGLSYPLTVIQAMFIVALCIIGFWKRGWIRIMAAIGIIIWGAYMTAYDMKLAAPLIGLGVLLFFMSIFTLIRGYRESQV